MPFAFAFGHGEYLAGRLLEFDLIVSIGVVFCRRHAVVCSFLQSTKQEGQWYRAMGFHVKTVLVILFEGFPNRLLLVGFSPSRSYCHIFYGNYAEPEIETFWY